MLDAPASADCTLTIIAGHEDQIFTICDYNDFVSNLACNHFTFDADTCPNTAETIYVQAGENFGITWSSNNDLGWSENRNELDDAGNDLTRGKFFYGDNEDNDWLYFEEYTLD